MCKEYEGRIKINKTGSAIVVCDNGTKIKIKKGKTGLSLNGDIVAYSKNSKNEYYVLKVIKETKRRYRGILSINETSCFFRADGNFLHKDIYIRKEETYGCDSGDLAVVEIECWKLGEKSPRGHIIELIGEDTFDNQMESILIENGIRTEFNSSCMEELDKMSTIIKTKDLKNRKDFRNITTFTIDPEDAKDFDDALSIEKLENGNYSIGIHIADVTNYIKKDCELDKEAYERSFSTYLVDRVVPMLPEKLSNGLCSLNPNEDKLTYSVVVEMNENAKIIKKWIGKTIINSNKRFAYSDAQERIENPENDLDFSSEVCILDKLAKIMRGKRMNNGSLDFNSKEPRFKIKDENPVEIYLKESKDANKLIEEFMLLANKIVAMFINENEYHCPYRVHDTPDEDKLKHIQKLAKYLGYDELDGLNSDTSYEKLNLFLGNLKENDHRTIFEKLSIRSMAKATYSIENIGHFGLGFDKYCHFTSPIRRYSDVLVHRILTKILYNKKKKDNVVQEESCRHISNKEKVSSTAERMSVKVAQIYLLKDKIGESYESVVTNISEQGIFVDIIDYGFNGMVSFDNIKTSDYVYKDEYSIVNSENQYIKIGDKIEVNIYNVDIINRLIDFSIE